MGERASFVYQRHRPEDSVLYKIIQENLETFLRQAQIETGYPLPEFVEREFREYLKCGILAYGFLRVQCESCLHENLVAFSCKRRGFCPSCGGRRMSESAIHLVDEVLPQKLIRQWVLSFPFQLRLLLAIRPKIMAEVLHITNSAITKHLRRKAGLPKTKAKTGSVTLIQRFGGSINLNVLVAYAPRRPLGSVYW
jgi:ribosomal protein S27E